MISVSEIQQKISDSLCVEQPRMKTNIDWLPEFIKNLRNNQSDKLKNFANKINENHAEVSCHLSDDDWNKLKTEVESNSVSEKLLSMMDRIRPRTISDSATRELFRQKKNTFTDIDLSILYTLGENCIDVRPDCFGSIARGSSGDLEIINKIQSQISDFTKFNLKAIAGLLEKKSNAIKSLYNEGWNGFCKLKTTDAAVMLAKMHGFFWNETFNLFQKSTFISKKYIVVDEMIETNQNELDPIRKLLINKDKRLGKFDYFGFQYQARLYPIHMVKNMPVTTAQIINATESMELVGGASFDYYWVVVPGVNVDHPNIKHGDKPHTLRLDGKITAFPNAKDAAFAMDQVLIRDGVVVPCVLGERDGKCYFVCFWS